MALNFRNQLSGLRSTVNPDPPEVPYRPGQKTRASSTSFAEETQRAGVNPFYHVLESATGGEWSPINLIRQVANMVGSAGSFGNTDLVGTNFGDQLFGVRHNYYDIENAKGAGSRIGDYLGRGFNQLGARQSGPTMPDTPMPGDLQSFLSMAQQILGGPNTVSYDPLRQSARSQASDYDARVEAMYNQLTNSIRGDAPTIKGNFQEGIDATEARGAETRQAIQGASDAAAAKNLETLQALGLGEAAGNIVAQGQDLNTQTARSMGESAQRQQIVGDQLGTHQQASLAHNTNLAGAAGLEGAEQRNRIQHQLASLLAQYDVAEQEANQQAQQSFLGQQLGLAQALSGDAWQRQNYQDDLMKFLFEQQAANQPGPDPFARGLNVVTQLQQQFPELSQEEIESLLNMISTGNKIYR